MVMYGQYDDMNHMKMEEISSATAPTSNMYDMVISLR
uniref:Uncharacterized protein n=1 Tax=Arundo donax TaxID=35708 RepID=A0A0A8ZB92_ARUDO